MNQSVAVQNDASEIMESVISKGDIAKLTPAERTSYYMQVCHSIGLNPLTRPFEYITLQGKMTLYARRDAADQLRKVNGINIEIVSKTVEDGILTVHVRAVDKTGRKDEDYGVVAVAGLKGDAAANAFLKAVTKAKRRVTLSISGLGFLDETEVETIPGAQPVREQRRPPAAKPSLIVAPTDDSDADLRTQGNAKAAEGTDALKDWWGILSAADRKLLKDDLIEWKKTATAADPLPTDDGEI